MKKQEKTEEKKNDKIESPEIKPFNYQGGIIIDKKVEMSGHRWIQKGIYLECRSCIIGHAIHIGVNKQLVGIDEEGLPKLVNIK